MSESMCPKCREMVSTNYGAVHRCKGNLWAAKYNPEPSDLTLKVESYESRIAELEDQLAAERADAERYRWLRDECDDWALFQGYVECEKEGLNAAIDAARKQATAPEQEGE